VSRLGVRVGKESALGFSRVTVDFFFFEALTVLGDAAILRKGFFSIFLSSWIFHEG